MSDNSSGLSQLNGDQKHIYASDGDLIRHLPFSGHLVLFQEKNY